VTTSNVENDETVCDKCGTLVSVPPLNEWNDGDLCHNCAQDCLRNLLAVIHKDGGQFACDHGMKQACEDAESNVQALSQRVAELEKELTESKKRCDELRKQLADLRVDRDTLAGEVKARRLPNGKTDEEHGKRWHTVQSAIEAVNASGALTRAGKDHT